MIVKNLHLLLLFFVMVFTGCEKALLGEDQATTDPHVNFDYLWREVESKYAFFELKDIQWQQVRDTLRPKIYAGMSQDSLFWVLTEMLNTLRDGHVNLIAPFNVSAFPFQQQGPKNFDFRVITDHYLSNRSYRTGPLRHDFIANGEVGYIRYAAFSNAVSEGHLNFVLERYANTKGLIIDIRENGGGQTSNGYRILARFIEARTAIGLVRTKNGPGPNDFSPTETVFLEPAAFTKYLKKVVVLTDRGSYSASSIFALACKAIPNVTLMGDTTGGGTGLPNGGQLPNAWTYRFSISQTLQALTGANYENGVPPDVVAFIDPTATDKDAVIDAAVRFILD